MFADRLFIRNFAVIFPINGMKRLRNIMFAGTGSDVGKSVIAAAFCRIFRQDARDREQEKNCI